MPADHNLAMDHTPHLTLRTQRSSSATSRTRSPFDMTLHQPVQNRQVRMQSHAGRQAQFSELDTALAAIGVGRSHALLLICIALLWAGDAAEVMALSYLSPAAACGFAFTSPTSQSLLTSAVFVGMLLGAAVWGWLGDSLGRKPAIMVSSALVVLAGVASAAAPTPGLLLASRALVGCGLAASTIAFTLMIELLPQRSRAVWGTSIELAYAAGVLAEAALAWAVLNRYGWRLLLLLSALPLAMLLVLVRWLPESPRFLLSQGDAASAAAVLRGLAAANGKSAPSMPLLMAAAEAQQAGGGGDGDTEALLGQQQQQPQVLSEGQDIRPGSDVHWQQQEQPVDGRQHRPMHHHLQSAADTNSSNPTKAAAAAGTLSRKPRSFAEDQSPLPPNPGSSSGPSPSDATITQQHSPSPCYQGHQQQQPVILKSLQLPSVHGLAAEVSTLLGSSYGTITALLMLSWAASELAYFGLVQLATELHLQAAAGGAGGAGPVCVDGMLQVPNSDYAAVMVTALAEVPAVAWAAYSSKSWGGRPALLASLMLAAACLLPAVALQAGTALLPTARGAYQRSAVVASSLTNGVTAACMFGSRLFVSAAFVLLWVFTPSHFPTRVRGLGMGLCATCGRVGGALSPFAAINLSQAAGPAVAQAVFGALCVAAAGTVVLTPQGHVNSDQQLEEEEDEG